MMPDLFSQPPESPENAHKAQARVSDPDTSHAAGKALTPKVQAIQAEVLAMAYGTPIGFTDIALNEHFGSISSTYRSRRAELVTLGLIEDTGRTEKIGGKGRAHTLWAITLKGMQVHEDAKR